MATNCCCWAWHGVTAAAWSLVFIHWIFCDHDTASVHIVTDNQRHSHRTQEGCFHISSTFWKDVCIRLFCWLVGWFEIQNTCFPVSFAFVMWLTSSLKGFNTYLQDGMGLFISLCALSLHWMWLGYFQARTNQMGCWYLYIVCTATADMWQMFVDVGKWPLEKACRF